ncbi:hypothetical protein AAC691_21445 [Nguyenibacter vanlangensis]|uniref:Uncharacterized protein n=1 Tax=Nguyenibacter vanlangensis TaxID=1216886 RepID=A0ABZ3D4X1_9PROT
MSQTRAHRSRKCRGRAGNGALPKDLYAYAEARPLPRIGRPPKCEPETWTVTDDWPDPLPVTQAEIDLFEAWFGDFFDELFGPIP